MNWTEAGTILALILLNGFFAGSELALVSARKSRLKARADAGHAGARAALKLLEDPTRLLSSLQIGITLVGILTGVYSGAVFAEDLAHVLERMPALQPYAKEAAFGIVVVAMTYLPDPRRARSQAGGDGSRGTDRGGCLPPHAMGCMDRCATRVGAQDFHRSDHPPAAREERDRSLGHGG